MLRVNLRTLRALAVFGLLTACGTAETPTVEGDDDSDDDTAQDESSSETPPKKDAGAGTRSDAGKPTTTKTDASSSTTRNDAGSSRSDASAGGDNKGKGLPCDIAPIVGKHCADCHGDDPNFGAEFSLTSIADFQAVSPTDDARKIHEVAAERIGLSGAKRMPPASKPALPAEDLKKLGDWLKGGAKASGQLCPVAAPSAPSTGGDGGVDYEPAGSGGAHTKPIKYDDPEMKCYPFVAFSKTDRKGKYPVPTNPDYYVAFLMKAPWQGTQYIRSFRGIIDNKDVIHHWLFFKNLSGGRDGTVQENALGAHPDGEMLFGWAPGGDDMYMDPDVGMAVTGNDVYLLEAHYNNKKGMPSPDASGVEVCVTPKKPANVAALTWIGTDLINGTTATGQCNSTHTVPVRIFSAQPHMHTKGKHMKVVVNRKGGMKETIHDEDFDFEYQRSYNLNVTLQPGDTLTTTCTFSAPARFGKGTSDEMCYFFSNSYPAGALTMPGIGTIVHGPNSCL